jgi:hypothetical protein
VEMQFWPYDGCPLIQGLLGTSWTFLGLPYVLYEPIKSWPGRIHQVWQ